jgi:hypothetical protein
VNILRKIVLLSVVVMAGLLLAVACSDRARLTLFSPEGHKSSGEILGAHIGMSTSEFRSAIESHGFEFWKQEKKESRCPRYRIQAESIDVYVDQTWWKGVVCAGSTKGKVVMIAWYFDPLTP